MDTKVTYLVERDALSVRDFFPHSAHGTLQEAVQVAKSTSKESFDCPVRVLEVTRKEVFSCGTLFKRAGR